MMTDYQDIPGTSNVPSLDWADLLTNWLHEHFVTRLRHDVHAAYFPPKKPGERGGYFPVKERGSGVYLPLEVGALRLHVTGTRPLGAYFFDPAAPVGTVRAAVIDLDDKKHELTWFQLCQEALKVSQELESRGLVSLPVRSGSGHGVHLWLLWADHQPAAVIRRLFKEVVQVAAPAVHVDLFPSQDKLPPPHADGTPALGNLVALPFTRASRPIVNLAMGEVHEDLASWSGVRGSPALARSVVSESAGSVKREKRSVSRGSQVGSADLAPTEIVEVSDSLSEDEGRGLQLVSTNDQDFGRADPATLASALAVLDSADYELWKRVTLALKGAEATGQLSGDDAFKVWDEWSQTGGKSYDPKDNYNQWDRGFRWREGGTTLGTVFHEARLAGWVPPVRILNKETGAMSAAVAPIMLTQALPPTSTRASLMTAAQKFRGKEPAYYEALLQWKRGSGTRELDQLNQDHFQAFDGGKLYICKERWDEALKRWTLEHRSVRDFRDANRDVVSVLTGPGAKGKGPSFKDRHVGDLWLESPYRRRYEEIVFKPSGCQDWQYNLWRGWAVEPNETGDWSLFKDHMFENICRGDPVAYDYIFNWLAYTVQHMDEPIGTALILRGNKGTGKGFFVKKIGQLFGQSFMQVTSAKSVTGNFNSHLRDCVLLFADEAFCTGNLAEEARLNALITEETITIEGKGRDAVSCRNMLHLIMATNKDWAAPATADERRFCCVNVGDGGQLVRGYFDRVDEQLTAGGLGRLLWDLLHADLSGWDRRNVPATHELTEQKLQNMTADGKWWFQKLSDGALLESQGEWLGEVPAYALFDDYVAFCDKQRSWSLARLGSQEHLIKAVGRMIESAGAVKRWRKRVPGVLGQGGMTIMGPNKGLPTVVKTVWKFPPLEACRKAFNDWQKINVNWEEVAGTYQNAVEAEREQGLDSQEEIEF